MRRRQTRIARKPRFRECCMRGFELLEPRQMLNAAPVANDDHYVVAEDSQLSITTSIEGTQITPVRWSDNGHYYAFVPAVPGGISWTDANAAANATRFLGTGGHLATITSAAEQNFLANSVLQPLRNSHFNIWIGLTDVAVEGDYRWVTGEPFSYSNWQPGEPNHIGTDDDYIHLVEDNGKFPWNDHHNVNHEGYVVEFEGSFSFPLLSNDTDAEQDALTVALVAGPQRGTLSLNSNGTFTYTPNQDIVGTDTFTYKANDGQADSNVASVTINVTPVNDAPAVNADSYRTAQNQALTVPALQGVLENDADLEGDTLSAILETGPTHGQVTLNVDGSFTYTPAAGYFGNDQFTYRASDGALQSAAATVSLFVTNPNNVAPVAVNDSYTTQEDTVLSVMASAPGNLNIVRWSQNGHFYAFVQAGITWTDANVAANALRFLGASGHLATITSAAEQNFLTSSVLQSLRNSHFNIWIGLNDVAVEGDYRWVTGEPFSYSNWQPGAPNNVSNEDYVHLVEDNGTFPWNDRQNLIHDGYLVEFDGPFRGGVLENDSDVNGDAISAVLVTQAEHGTVVLNSDGTFTYTPTPNYSGPDSFTYKGNDGDANSNVGMVNIAVTPVNDGPTAVADSYSVAEDTKLTVNAAQGLLANDSDLEGNSFTAELVAAPSHGAVTLNANGSFTYMPSANFFGTDTFTYRAIDSEPGQPATVTITMTPVNDAPVAHDDTFELDEDSKLDITNQTTVSTVSLATMDLVYDPGNDRILASVPAAAATHANTITSIDPYTGALGTSVFVGADPQTFVLSSDGRYMHVVVEDRRAIQTVDIAAGTLGPKVTLSAGFGGQYPERVWQIHAIPGQPDAVMVTRYVANISPSTSGTSIYKAGVELPEYSGRGTGTGGADVTAVDSSGTRAFGYETYSGHDPFYVLQIVPTGLRPLQTFDNGAFLSGNLRSFRYSRDRIYTNTGLVKDIPTNTVVGNFAPSDNFVIDETLNKLFGLTTSGTMQTIHIYDLNSLAKLDTIIISGQPLIQGSLVRFGGDGLAFRGEGDKIVLVHSEKISGTARRGVLLNDNDAENDRLTAQLVAGPTHGELSFSADGTFTYTPNPNFSGTDSFMYKASDSKLESNVAKVTLNVLPADDPPIAVADSYFVADTLTVTAANGVLANDTDLDTPKPNLIAQLITPPSAGTLTFDASGSFTYTRGLNFTGNDTFTYRTSDGTTTSAPVTVTIAAALRLRTENVTIVSAPTAAVEGFFDVYLDVAPGFDFAVAGYDVALRTAAGSGVTLVSAGAPSTAHSALFTTDPTFLVSAGTLRVTDALATGAAHLDNGDGLFRVRFTVAPETVGDVPLLFTPAFTNLADTNGNALPIDRTGGVLTVTEPPAPKVTGVFVRGSAWSQAFGSSLGTQGLGYSIPSGDAQLNDVPWLNIDQIIVKFNEHVSVQQNDLSVQGVNNASYATSAFAYDPATFTATWTLAQALSADKVRIQLAADGADPIRNAAGVRLDGDWTDGSSAYPSGNGRSGGDFSFRFDVLPGNVDQTGPVNIFDTIKTRNRQFTSAGDSNYSPLYDINGSGDINIFDTVQVRNRQFTALPDGEPAASVIAASPLSGAFSVDVAQTADETGLSRPSSDGLKTRKSIPASGLTRLGSKRLAVRLDSRLVIEVFRLLGTTELNTDLLTQSRPSRSHFK